MTATIILMLAAQDYNIVRPTANSEVEFVSPAIFTLGVTDLKVRDQKAAKLFESLEIRNFSIVQQPVLEKI